MLNQLPATNSTSLIIPFLAGLVIIIIAYFVFNKPKK
ncbi:LPXTG cell wall anchor domain-containing protein [Candidatus Berkelbacteria bacterium]|nr:LPXTG cell wall anchor domain-containing protein [Candidatus Berkelbacteria bacterium]MBI2588542.1 LPXTG cell wall anchor domain-containing protein [Candidatus Berkelbacteria bacterium]MBI4029658.1 LPXTG cell wall anchor domain-containing protein [Candidatus Berkelbacteria bacterium]